MTARLCPTTQFTQFLPFHLCAAAVFTAFIYWQKKLRWHRIISEIKQTLASPSRDIIRPAEVFSTTMPSDKSEKKRKRSDQQGAPSKKAAAQLQSLPPLAASVVEDQSALAPVIGKKRANVHKMHIILTRSFCTSYYTWCLEPKSAQLDPILQKSR